MPASASKTVVILTILFLLAACGKTKPTATTIPPAPTSATPTPTSAVPSLEPPPSPLPAMTLTPAMTTAPASPTPKAATPESDPSSASGLIAFVSTRDGNGEIYVMQADGSAPRRLTNRRQWDGYPSWSPDGRQIAYYSYISSKNWVLKVVSVEGGEPRQLTDNGACDGAPYWSPDGALIAYNADADCSAQRREIYVIDSDGGNPRNLTQNEADDMGGSWSPDGQQIVFASNRDGDYELYVLDVSVIADDGSGETRRLTDNPAQDMMASWSPDGRQIAFVSDRDGNEEIYLMDVEHALQSIDGENLRRLTQEPGADWFPFWSPDGSQLVFSSRRDGNLEIYTLDVASGATRRLTDDPADDLNAVWQPAPVAQAAILRQAQDEAATPVPTAPQATFAPATATEDSASEPSPPQTTPWPVLAEWQGTQGPVYSVDWSPDGRIIATTGRDHVRLWDGETYEELATLQDFEGFVWCARWSPDSSLLAVSSIGAPIRLYDARDYSLQGVIGGPSMHHVAWSPDGALLAAGTEFSRDVQVWNVGTGEMEYELNGDYGVSGMAWSPDGSTLAVGQYDAAVTLWNTHTHTPIRRLIDGEDVLIENEAQGLSWSPDGRLVAYIQRHDGGWRIWDAQTGELVHRVSAHNSWGLGLAWSPDRPLLASVGWDSAVRIWDVQTGQAMGAGECDAGSLHSVDWSPDGQRLVAGQGLYFGWNSAESLCVVGAPLASEQAQAPVGQTLSVTIVYDNTAYDPDLRAEWGFAAWIEYGGHTLLFDTGGDSPTLLNNMEKLGLDPQKIEAVVLSHIHGDHVGGLQGLLSTGITPTVYALASFPRSFKEAVRSQVELVEVRDGLEILPGLHSTGELQGPVVEQALAIETSEGLVVITGCAHPGIVRIVREARAIVDEDVALVLGGFHLMGTSASGVRGIISDLRQLGVRRASPTHCTGERAIAIFAENFGEDYEPGGAGRVFVVGGGEN